jgi:hypothetical protein
LGPITSRNKKEDYPQPHFPSEQGNSRPPSRASTARSDATDQEHRPWSDTASSHESSDSSGSDSDFDPSVGDTTKKQKGKAPMDPKTPSKPPKDTSDESTVKKKPTQGPSANTPLADRTRAGRLAQQGQSSDPDKTPTQGSAQQNMPQTPSTPSTSRLNRAVLGKPGGKRQSVIGKGKNLFGKKDEPPPSCDDDKSGAKLRKRSCSGGNGKTPQDKQASRTPNKPSYADVASGKKLTSGADGPNAAKKQPESTETGQENEVKGSTNNDVTESSEKQEPQGPKSKNNNPSSTPNPATNAASAKKNTHQPESERETQPKPSGPKEAPKPSAPKEKAPKPSGPTSNNNNHNSTPNPATNAASAKKNTHQPASQRGNTPKPPAPKKKAPKPATPKKKATNSATPRKKAPNSATPKKKATNPPVSNKKKSLKPATPKKKAPKPATPKKKAAKPATPKKKAPEHSAAKGSATTALKKEAPKAESLAKDAAKEAPKVESVAKDASAIPAPMKMVESGIKTVAKVGSTLLGGLLL